MTKSEYDANQKGFTVPKQKMFFAPAKKESLKFTTVLKAFGLVLVCLSVAIYLKGK